MLSRTRASYRSSADRSARESRPEGGTSDGKTAAKYVSVKQAMWNNLLTIAEGQITGDANGWVADEQDDIFGTRDRDVLHVVHHGRRGGVYKAWAASESEGRRLYQTLTRLQTELLRKQEDLHARIRHVQLISRPERRR